MGQGNHNRLRDAKPNVKIQSVREVKRMYQEMIDRLPKNWPYDEMLEGFPNVGSIEDIPKLQEAALQKAEARRFNCYVCRSEDCGYIAKVELLEPGTTPMFHSCPVCGSRSTSTMGTDLRPDDSPGFEWYRPTLRQTLRLRKPGKDHLLDHVLLGGLLWRRKPFADIIGTGEVIIA